MGGFPSPFPHWQVPACPAGNSSSPRCQGSLVSHPQISGLQISQETGIDLKRGDIRLVNPACSEEAKPCSLPLPSSWGPPRHSPEGKNSPISPHRLFQQGCSSRAPCPASHMVFSKCFLGRERREGTCASERTQIFHIESVSRGCGSLKQGKSVSNATFWNQQHRECLRGAQ